MYYIDEAGEVLSQWVTLLAPSIFMSGLFSLNYIKENPYRDMHVCIFLGGEGGAEQRTW